jgi:hypothetical protein
VLDTSRPGKDADRSVPPDDPGTWGPHDLVAALCIRDFLADWVSRLSAELRDKVTTATRAESVLTPGRLASHLSAETGIRSTITQIYDGTNQVQWMGDGAAGAEGLI